MRIHGLVCQRHPQAVRMVRSRSLGVEYNCFAVTCWKLDGSKDPRGAEGPP